jgi:hypothetical protein
LPGPSRGWLRSIAHGLESLGASSASSQPHLGRGHVLSHRRLLHMGWRRRASLVGPPGARSLTFSDLGEQKPRACVPGLPLRATAAALWGARKGRIIQSSPLAYVAWVLVLASRNAGAAACPSSSLGPLNGGGRGRWSERARRRRTCWRSLGEPTDRKRRAAGGRVSNGRSRMSERGLVVAGGLPATTESNSTCPGEGGVPATSLFTQFWPSGHMGHVSWFDMWPSEETPVCSAKDKGGRQQVSGDASD